MEYIRCGLNIRQELAARHIKEAELLQAGSRLDEAIEQLRHALACYQHGITLQPASVQWRQDLYLAHVKLGDGLLAQGNRTAALEQCRMARPILQELLASQPDNLIWRRELANRHNSEGNLLREDGRFFEPRHLPHLRQVLVAKVQRVQPRAAKFHSAIRVLVLRDALLARAAVAADRVAGQLRTGIDQAKFNEWVGYREKPRRVAARVRDALPIRHRLMVRA
jgi:tetratricopeptide (TPR) repeat protein